MAADGTITYEVKIDDKGAVQTLDQVKDGAENAGNTGAGAFDKMKLSTAALAAGVALVVAKLVEFTKASIETGLQFDKSMSQIAATMGTTVDQVSGLRDEAQRLGATTAFSAQQAAEGMNILAQSGLKEQEIIAALPDVLNLAAAGNLDLATSASYVTGAFKGFGDTAENAAKYTDLIAVGASKSNTTVQALGEGLSRAAATSASYGQSVEGTTLALLRLAEQNVTGAEAAQAMNRAMMDLYTPTSAAKKELDALGVSVYDANGNARDFNTVVDELNAALSSMSDEEANATKNAIFSTFGLQAFNKMTVSTTDKVDEFKEALAGAGGAAETMANTQLDNLAGDMTLFDSAVEGLQIKISDMFVPTLRTLYQTAQEVISGITNFITEHQAAFDGLASVLSGVVSIVLNVLSKGFQVLGVAMQVVFAIIEPLMIALGNFVGLVAPLFEVDMVTAIEKFEAVFSDLVGVVGGVLDAVLSYLGAFVSDWIKEGIRAFDEFVTNAVEYLHDLPEKIKGFLDNIITNAAIFVATLAIKGVQAASDFISGLLGGIQSGASDVVAFVKSIPGRILSALGNLGSLLVNAGSQIIGGLLDGITSKFDAVKNFVGGIGSWIAEHKGPEQYDKNLLVRQGGWIMEGFARGLEDGKSDVLAALQDITADISGYTIDAQLQPSATAGVFNNSTIVNINGITTSSPGVIDAATNLVNALQLDLRMGVA